MKLIRTADPYRVLIIDGKRIGPESVKVSNADADRLAAQADEAGIPLVVTDTDDADPTPSPAVQPTPDLSAGVTAITGGGDPVVNDADGVVNPDANETSAGTAQEA